MSYTADDMLRAIERSKAAWQKLYEEERRFNRILRGLPESERRNVEIATGIELSETSFHDLGA